MVSPCGLRRRLWFMAFQQILLLWQLTSFWPIRKLTISQYAASLWLLQQYPNVAMQEEFRVSQRSNLFSFERSSTRPLMRFVCREDASLAPLRQWTIVTMRRKSLSFEWFARYIFLRSLGRGMTAEAKRKPIIINQALVIASYPSPCELKKLKGFQKNELNRTIPRIQGFNWSWISLPNLNHVIFCHPSSEL